MTTWCTISSLPRPGPIMTVSKRSNQCKTAPKDLSTIFFLLSSGNCMGKWPTHVTHESEWSPNDRETWLKLCSADFAKPQFTRQGSPGVPCVHRTAYVTGRVNSHTVSAPHIPHANCSMAKICTLHTSVDITACIPIDIRRQNQASRVLTEVVADAQLLPTTCV